MHLGFPALHPKYCLLQAMFAENSSPSKYCKRSETCFGAEHSDLAISAGILLQLPSHFRYKNCIHTVIWYIHW